MKKGLFVSVLALGAVFFIPPVRADDTLARF